MCSKNVDVNVNGSVALSRFSILVGFICALSFIGAFVGTGWAYTKESYRLTNSNLYTSLTFKIGLWKVCHSFKKINSTINLPASSCTSISYTKWSDVAINNVVTSSDIESTLSVLTRMRWSAIFLAFALILIVVGLVYSIVGHYYQDNKTLLASAIYTLSGLSLGAGLFIFVCVLTDAFASHSSLWDGQKWNHNEIKYIHDYKYGWCFITANAACFFTELVAVLCITVHYRRCQTIAQIINDIMPIIEDKSFGGYFTTNDTVYVGTGGHDESNNEENIAKPSPDDSNGILSETPPDICSTFLNNTESIVAENLENSPRHSVALEKDEERFIQCSYKTSSGNFATLNTRNCKFPAGGANNKRYTRLGTRNLLPSMDGGGPSSSLASSSNTFTRTQLRHKNVVCVQSTVPRMQNCTSNNSKYHLAEKSAAKILENEQLSCDDINL